MHSNVFSVIKLWLFYGFIYKMLIYVCKTRLDLHIKKLRYQLGMVVQSCNSSSEVVETEDFTFTANMSQERSSLKNNKKQKKRKQTQNKTKNTRKRKSIKKYICRSLCYMKYHLYKWRSYVKLGRFFFNIYIKIVTSHSLDHSLYNP